MSNFSHIVWECIHSNYIHAPFQMTSTSRQRSNLRVWQNPLSRVDSITCALFHILHNRKLHPHHKLNNFCASCKKLSNEILQIQKRCNIVTTLKSRSKGRCQTRRYPLSPPSPTSQDIRNRCVRSEHKSLKKKVERYESEWKHILDDERSLRLCNLLRESMKVIFNQYSMKLSKRSVFNC